LNIYGIGKLFESVHCMLSVGYTMDTVYFSWLEKPPPVEIDPKVQLPQFELEDKKLHDCSQNYTAGMKP